MTPPRLDPLSVQAKLALVAELVEDFDAVGPIDGSRLHDDRLLRRAVERMLTQVVDLAAAVCRAVGMRNLLVDEYARADLDLVTAAVPQARDDAAAFVRQVSSWLLRES